MWRSRLALALMLALALAAVPGSPAQAQTVRVIVDGSPVFFDQPPAIVGGRTLIPLRGVFEQMGATVQWNPVNNSVFATRGSTQVQLTIGSRIAYVNGRQVMLDVPPMIINARTLVPLRFISESLGAHVQWLPATRTVFITSGAAQPPAPPPIAQPPPSQTTIEGTIYSIDIPNQRLFVQRGGTIHTVIITANTAITRVNAQTGQGGAVGLGDLLVGDQVTVTTDAAGRAILVRAQVREISGRIELVSGRTIALDTGQVFTLTDDARIIVNGVAVPRTSLRPGMVVTLRLSPAGQVVEVTAQSAAQPADTQPPVVTGRFPAPGTIVQGARPTIVITYTDTGSGVNPQTTTLSVNGRNVTARATVTETAISYTPPSDLPQGAVAVRAVIRDRAGNQTVDTWAFSIGVAQGGLIQGVTLSPGGTLTAGQTLTVTAFGQSGGQATFQIEGVAGTFPMVETQSGVYVGQFVVSPQHSIQNARVLVTLIRGGQGQTVAAASRVTLVGSGQEAFAPIITQPTAGTAVGTPIVVRGLAVPGARVTVRVDYEGSVLIIPIRGSYGEQSVTADAAGNWQATFTPTVRIPNARLTITARQTLPSGLESAPAQVQVNQS